MSTPRALRSRARAAKDASPEASEASDDSDGSDSDAAASSPLARVCSGDGIVSMSSSKKSRKTTKKTVAEPPPVSDTPASQVTRAVEGFWLTALNAGPTVSVIAIMATVFTLASLFLDTYVVDAQASLVVFVVGSYVVFSSYFMFDYYLVKLSTSYAAINRDNQFYVLSNLIKSAVLLSYCPIAARTLYQTIYLDVWPTQQIRNLGCMYAIPDFVSLLLVKKMGTTTILHHICVCLFNLYSLYNDYDEENICRLMVVYAIFSTFAYLVNLLLASRYLNFSNLTSALLSLVAGLLYVSCCAINWTWQVWYTRRLIATKNHYSIYIYIACILMVVWDDLVLIKWLVFNVRRKVAKMMCPDGKNKKKV